MLSVNMAIFLACLGLFFIIDGWLERKYGLQKSSFSTIAVLVGLFVGRAAFVLTHLEFYAEEPLTVFNILDRDLSMIAAIIGALAVASFYYQFRQAPKPLSIKRIMLIVSVAAVYIGSASLYNTVRQESYLNTDEVTVETIESGETSTLFNSTRPRVINYWATWCPPCIREMPRLIKAANRYGDTVDFIFVNQLQEPHQIREFEKRHNLRIPNLIINDGSNAELNQFGKGLPTTLFLNSDNKIIYKHMGEISNATLNAKINDLTDKADN